MAATTISSVVILLLLLGLQGRVLGGGVECEKLPVEMCAFAVSSAGVRCLLEKRYSPFDKKIDYECLSSGVMAEEMREWIESEECVEACGLERMSVGLSSDGIADCSPFTCKLCSHKCQKRCPNIAHLFLNLAAGEGMQLGEVCEGHRERGRRALSERAAMEGRVTILATPPMAS